MPASPGPPATSRRSIRRTGGAASTSTSPASSSAPAAPCRMIKAAAAARSSTCPRPPAASATPSAHPIRRPNGASSASPRAWRRSSGPTTSGSTRSCRASSKARASIASSRPAPRRWASAYAEMERELSRERLAAPHGHAEDVAAMVVFLCSPLRAQVSGQSLGVCGNVETLLRSRAMAQGRDRRQRLDRSRLGHHLCARRAGVALWDPVAAAPRRPSASIAALLDDLPRNELLNGADARRRAGALRGRRPSGRGARRRRWSRRTRPSDLEVKQALSSRDRPRWPPARPSSPAPPRPLPSRFTEALAGRAPLPRRASAQPALSDPGGRDRAGALDLAGDGRAHRAPSCAASARRRS